jgi:hypothetical protein
LSSSALLMFTFGGKKMKKMSNGFGERNVETKKDQEPILRLLNLQLQRQRCST